MVKCKTTAPKTITKGDCLGLPDLNIWTDKRIVFGEFRGVHFVLSEGSGNGKVQNDSPKGIDKRVTAVGNQNFTFLLLNITFWVIFVGFILSIERWRKCFYWQS